MTPADVIKLAQENNVKFIDLVFGDMFGALQRWTLPATDITETLFEEGAPFDGSSIRGWKSIDKSDMLMMPDPTSAFIDPFRVHTTLTVFCSILEPRTGELYERDARSIAEKAVKYLKSTGIGDTAFFGPEPEFFIFDSISFSSEPSSAFYAIDSEEGWWTSGEEGGNGRVIQHGAGYSPASPVDTQADLRNEISLNLHAMGVVTEVHHHEVAVGQSEIGTRFAEIVHAGDQVHKLKYAVKNTAAKYGKTATFMPKPLFGDNGSGMHVHHSIFKDGENIFSGDLYADLSQEALWAIGGVLKNAQAIQGFSNASENSYRRLVPGYEAPTKLAYSATNRSASIRIPYVANPKGRRFEVRFPDSSGSAYLTFAAIMMASLEGIKNQIDPGAPADKNIYDLPAEELASIPSAAESLEGALAALDEGKDFLTAGGVFDEGMIQAYIEYKTENEVMLLKLRPNPVEFQLYFDA